MLAARAVWRACKSMAGFAPQSWVIGLPWTCASGVGRRAESGSVCGKICKPSRSPARAVCSWIQPRCARIPMPLGHQKNGADQALGRSREGWSTRSTRHPRRKLRGRPPPDRRPRRRRPGNFAALYESPRNSIAAATASNASSTSSNRFPRPPPVMTNWPRLSGPRFASSLLS